MRNSLRIRLTVIFIGLAVGPLLLVGIILAQRSFAVGGAQALDFQHQVAQRVSTEIDSFLQDVENDVNSIFGDIRHLEEPDRAQQISLLLGAFTSGPYRNIYEEFILLDGQGQEQLHVSRDEIFPVDQLRDRSGTAEFEQPRTTDQTYFSPVWFDEKTGEMLMAIAIPLFKPRSVQLKGVLIANIEFDTVGDLISSLQVSAGQTIYVVDSTGQVVAHQDRSVALPDLHFAAPETGDNQIGLTGDNVVLSTATIQLGEQELTVVAERPRSEALASATDTVYTIAATIIVALVAASGLGILIIGQIVRPITAMSATAGAISVGDLSQQVKVTSRDEIGTLATAFNSMTAQLRDLIGTLEQRVANRTQRLEILATLAGQLSAALDREALLAEVVNQVKANFGYYHAHIYLFDDTNENLMVAQGTGEAGAEMKRTDHSIPLDAPASLVARAARTGEIVAVDNVREIVDWLPNPLLPDTYSEMAVPIMLEGTVIGVLDVQEDKIAGLDDADANLLRSLASHVAVAIRNARLFDEVTTALGEARAAQERYLERAWTKPNLAARRGKHHYARPGVVELDVATLTEAKQLALEHSQPQVIPLENGDSELASILAPVALRNKTIGTLQLYPLNDRQSWTEDDLDIVEAVLEQLAQSAENLRLFEETRERASREHLIGEIHAKMRRATDIETLMKMAIDELSNVMGTTHAFVRLGAELEFCADSIDQPDKKGFSVTELLAQTERNGVESFNGHKSRSPDTNGQGRDGEK